jgi:hypothetical protein
MEYKQTLQNKKSEGRMEHTSAKSVPPDGGLGGINFQTGGWEGVKDIQLEFFFFFERTSS